MPSALADWVNARGPVILDRMYEMLPLMVASAVSAALFVYWVLGARRRDGDGGDPIKGRQEAAKPDATAPELRGWR